MGIPATSCRFELLTGPREFGIKFIHDPEADPYNICEYLVRLLASAPAPISPPPPAFTPHQPSEGAGRGGGE